LEGRTEVEGGSASRTPLCKQPRSRLLTRAQGNRTQAARLLGVSRRMLYNKLGEYGLE
jgi:DNA-binding NtrC family response regulator